MPYVSMPIQAQPGTSDAGESSARLSHRLGDGPPTDQVPDNH